VSRTDGPCNDPRSASTKIGYGRLRRGRMQLAHVISNTNDAGACIDGLRDERPAMGSTCTWCRLRTCHWQHLTEPRDLNNLDTEHTAVTKGQGNIDRRDPPTYFDQSHQSRDLGRHSIHFVYRLTNLSPRLGRLSIEKRKGFSEHCRRRSTCPI
jgi:hypothetical protein